MKHYLLASFLLTTACQSAADKGQSATHGATVVTTTKAATEAENPRISLEAYNQLKIGMPQEEVETVMGSPGKEISASQKGSTKTVFQEWTSGESITVRLMFQNERLVDKTQHGLQ
jgi:hypothetical protein